MVPSIVVMLVVHSFFTNGQLNVNGSNIRGAHTNCEGSFILTRYWLKKMYRIMNFGIWNSGIIFSIERCWETELWEFVITA
jgi:hypothetical protein